MQTLGPDHPDTAAPLLNLAGIWASQSRFEESKRTLLDVHRIWLDAYGPEHTDVAIACHALANLYRDREQWGGGCHQLRLRCRYSRGPLRHQQLATAVARDSLADALRHLEGSAMPTRRRGRRPLIERPPPGVPQENRHLSGHVETASLNRVPIDNRPPHHLSPGASS